MNNEKRWQKSDCESRTNTYTHSNRQRRRQRERLTAGRCTSQNARSWLSSTLRSNLSRFLSTLQPSQLLNITRQSTLCLRSINKHPNFMYARLGCCLETHVTLCVCCNVVNCCMNNANRLCVSLRSIVIGCALPRSGGAIW